MYQLFTVRQYFHQNLSLQYIWTALTSFPISPSTFFLHTPPILPSKPNPRKKKTRDRLQNHLTLWGEWGGGGLWAKSLLPEFTTTILPRGGIRANLTVI